MNVTALIKLCFTVSIWRCRLTSIGIPMLKIRQSCDCFIFNMRILIPDKRLIFILRQGPAAHLLPYSIRPTCLWALNTLMTCWCPQQVIRCDSLHGNMGQWSEELALFMPLASIRWPDDANSQIIQLWRGTVWKYVLSSQTLCIDTYKWSYICWTQCLE